MTACEAPACDDAVVVAVVVEDGDATEPDDGGDVAAAAVVVDGDVSCPWRQRRLVDAVAVVAAAVGVAGDAMRSRLR